MTIINHGIRSGADPVSVRFRNTDEFVSSFGDSIIEVLFKGLELKKK